MPEVLASRHRSDRQGEKGWMQVGDKARGQGDVAGRVTAWARGGSLFPDLRPVTPPPPPPESDSHIVRSHVARRWAPWPGGAFSAPRLRRAGFRRRALGAANLLAAPSLALPAWGASGGLRCLDPGAESRLREAKYGVRAFCDRGVARRKAERIANFDAKRAGSPSKGETATRKGRPRGGIDG